MIHNHEVESSSLSLATASVRQCVDIHVACFCFRRSRRISGGCLAAYSTRRFVGTDSCPFRFRIFAPLAQNRYFCAPVSSTHDQRTQRKVAAAATGHAAKRGGRLSCRVEPQPLLSDRNPVQRLFLSSVRGSAALLCQTAADARRRGVPYDPPEDLGINFMMYTYRESGEHAFTIHEGYLYREQLDALIEALRNA